MSLFSIITPSYNRPDLLERLLMSIQRQTIRDFEVVVVDDASTDQNAYERVVERFSADFPLRYLRNKKNQGAQYSRNRGVSESTGELVAFVDDDDEWMPTKLERQATIFRAAPERLGLVYAWADSVTADGSIVHRYRVIHRGKFLAELLDACFVPSPTVVVRRTAILKTGGFDESLPSCQDWDMWTRISEAGYDIDVVEEVLALHHKHGRASIGTSPQSLQGFLRYYEKHAALYERMRMKRNLSEKYRGLAYQALQVRDRELEDIALRCSLKYWYCNWKAWVRYAQFFIRGKK